MPEITDALGSVLNIGPASLTTVDLQMLSEPKGEGMGLVTAFFLFLRRSIPTQLAVLMRNSAPLAIAGAAFASAVHAQTIATYTVLHNSTTAEVPDASERTGLVQAADGNFYGATRDGGGTCNYSGVTISAGCGTLYRMTPDGTYTIIHSFVGTDGANPSSLVLGSDGNLYGTTYQGGPPCSTDTLLEPGGCGTVFRASLNGAVSTIQTFDLGPNGNWITFLTQGWDGNLYGVASLSSSGCGTVFSLTPAGTFTLLYTFTGNLDGLRAWSIVEGLDGALYGVSAGDTASGPYLTSLFKLPTSGGALSVLQTLYSSYNSLANPLATLLLGQDGNVYGTNFGLSTSDSGSLFRLNPDGSLTTLYSFTGGSDHAHPAVMVQNSAGTFFGLTSGGTVGYGSLFSFVPGGKLTTLYSQPGTADIYDPNNITMSSAGNLYGTVPFGGTNEVGMIYAYGFAPLEVSLLDPVPTLVNGLGVVKDPPSLAAGTNTVAGVAADDTAQVVVRIKTHSAGTPVQLTLEDEQGIPANAGDGPNLGYLTTLLSSDGTASTEGGAPITVTSVLMADGTGMAFAVYHAARDFVRGQTPTDTGLATRQVAILAQAGPSSTTKPFQLVRPPVAFIHGLWGSAADGSDIVAGLQSQGLGVFPTAISFDADVNIVSSTPSYGTNYRASGANLGFKYGATQVLGQLNNVIAQYRTTNPLSLSVAVEAADIVAHSMGGDVTRTLPSISGYFSPLNFGTGPVHKLISIGTPHIGSPVGLQMLQSTSSCSRGILARAHQYSITTANTSKGSYPGGVGDLKADLGGSSSSLSAALQAIQHSTTKITIKIPTGLIAGVMTASQLATVDSDWHARVIRAICSNDPWLQR